MLRQRVLGFIAVSAVLMAAPASAQDFSIPGTSPMDLAPQSQALTSSVIGNISVGNTARARTRGAAPMRQGQSRGLPALSFGAGAQLSNARLSYATTPASRKQALDAYLARAQRSNPRAAAALGPELRRRNIEAEMVAALRPYGLRTDDAADVMTTFLVAGWEIMTGGDATPAQVQGVRRQVAGQLITVPAMRSPVTRTQFGDELKITTFVLLGGAASARREGTLAEYRRGLASFYRAQTGEDIGRWRLTPAGFAQ